MYDLAVIPHAKISLLKISVIGAANEFIPYVSTKLDTKLIYLILLSARPVSEAFEDGLLHGNMTK